MTMLDVLKGINIPDEMGINDDDSSDLSPNAAWFDGEVYYQARKAELPVHTDWGCSQFVIISGKDVYKLPFDGLWYPGYDEKDWETDEVIHHYDDSFENYAVNHCAKAVDVYQCAVVEGVDKIFAKMEIAGYSINKCAIYKQEYATTWLDEDKKASDESTSKAKEIESKQHVPFDSDWFALAIDWYGFSFMQRVLDFIEEYEVDDLHRNNYGFAEDGRPIVYDYCSYDNSVVF